MFFSPTRTTEKERARTSGTLCCGTAKRLCERYAKPRRLVRLGQGLASRQLAVLNKDRSRARLRCCNVYGYSMAFAIFTLASTPEVLPGGKKNLGDRRILATIHVVRPHWARFRLWIANCCCGRSASPLSAVKACSNTAQETDNDKRTCCSGAVCALHMDTAVLKIDSSSASISRSATEK